MSLKSYAKALGAALVRRTTPIMFGDLRRVGPINRPFASARGTSVDRRYIAEHLTTNRNLIRGDVLEVGEARYAAQFSEGVTTKSILVPPAHLALPATGVAQVLVADLTDTDNIPEGQFDAFICTQTLNFIYDVRAAVRSAHRLLRPGGAFIGSVAGICQISTYDAERWGDYWRFMPMTVDRLLSEQFGQNVYVRTFGNTLAACCQLQGIAVEDLPDSSLLDTPDPEFPVIIGFQAVRAL